MLKMIFFCHRLKPFTFLKYSVLEVLSLSVQNRILPEAVSSNRKMGRLPVPGSGDATLEDYDHISVIYIMFRFE